MTPRNTTILLQLTAVLLALAAAPGLCTEANWWDEADAEDPGYRVANYEEKFENEGVEEGDYPECSWECYNSRSTDWYITETGADVRWRPESGALEHVDYEGGQGTDEETGTERVYVEYWPGVLPTDTIHEDDGDVTSATETTLTATGAAWTEGEWVNGTVEITSGTGAGQWRVVTANTATQITVDRAWEVEPNGTSEYEVRAHKKARFEDYGYVTVYCKRPLEVCEPPARSKQLWVLDVNLETIRGGGPGNNNLDESPNNGDGSVQLRTAYDGSTNDYVLGVGLNNDDDNEDQTPDLDQDGPVPDEDDLVELRFQFTQGILELQADSRQPDKGKVTIRIAGDAPDQYGDHPRLRLWKSQTKGSSNEIELSWDESCYKKVYNLNTQWTEFSNDLLDANRDKPLYVEGYTLSSAAHDATVELEFEHEYKTTTDTVQCTVVDVEIVVPVYDEDGEWTGEFEAPESHFIMASDPNPVVEIEEASATLSASGRCRVTLSGNVTDAIADIVPNGAADLEEIEFFADGTSLGTEALERDENETTTLVRPYAYKAEFEKTVTFTAHAGVNRVYAVTSKNGADNTGFDAVGVVVGTRTLYTPGEGEESSDIGEIVCNFVFSGDTSATEVDTLTFYFGDRAAVEDDPELTETGPNTLVFEGSIPGMGDVTVTLGSGLAFNPATQESVNAEVVINRDGDEETVLTLDGDFDEQGTSSKRLVLRLDTGTTKPGEQGVFVITVDEPFDDGAADTVGFGFGSEDPATLTETGVASLEFDGTHPDAGDMTVTLSNVDTDRGDIGGAPLDTEEFDTSACADPSIVYVSDGVYAIAYRGPDDGGFLKTVEIDSEGTIGSVLDTLEFDAEQGKQPAIIRVSGDIFAVAYCGPDDDGFLKTVEIKPDGDITEVKGTLEFDTAQGKAPVILWVSGEIHAVAYCGPDDDGFVKTIDINDDGTIDGVVDTLEFDTTEAKTPSLTAVGDDAYAVAYCGAAADGYVATFGIDDEGDIGAVTETLEFDTAQGKDPILIGVGGGQFAVAYCGADDDGFVKTIEIDGEGDIVGVTDTFEFDAAHGQSPSIVAIPGVIYAIAYTGADGDGFLKTVEIETDGGITEVKDTLEFDAADGASPYILPVAGTVYAIAYAGADADGYLATVDIDPAFDPRVATSVDADLEITQTAGTLSVSAAFAARGIETAGTYTVAFDVSDRLRRSQVNFALTADLDPEAVDTMRISFGTAMPTENDPLLTETAVNSRIFEGSNDDFDLLRVELPAGFSLDAQQPDQTTATVGLTPDGGTTVTTYENVAFTETGANTKQFTGYLPRYTPSGLNGDTAGRMLVLEEVEHLGGSLRGSFCPMLVRIVGPTGADLRVMGTMFQDGYEYEAKSYETPSEDEYLLLAYNPPVLWTRCALKDISKGADVERFVKDWGEGELADAKCKLTLTKDGTDLVSELGNCAVELCFGTLNGATVPQVIQADNAVEDLWHIATDWGDIKLIDVGGGADNNVNIVGRVAALRQVEKRFNIQIGSLGIRCFRLDCDVAVSYKDDQEPKDEDCVAYSVPRFTVGDYPDTGPVYFAKTGAPVSDLIPGEEEMGDDGTALREIACMDFAAVGLQAGAQELECDALRDALKGLGYRSRGVAHPAPTGDAGWDWPQIAPNRGHPVPYRDYDPPPQKNWAMDDKGGRYWGRPIANAEFAASGGVEKLVISVYALGEDPIPKGQKCQRWKQPGRHEDGVDHILFRSPADVFYIAGWGSYHPAAGGHLASICGITDLPWGGLHGVEVMIAPTDQARDTLRKPVPAGEPEGDVATAWRTKHKDKIVSLESAWTSEVEWFGFNNNNRLHLNAASLPRYVTLAQKHGMHGVLGFEGGGWSGSKQSKEWVETGAALPIMNAWITSMVGGTGGTRAAIVWYKEGSDWRLETFTDLKDTDSGTAAQGWAYGRYTQEYTPPPP